MGPPLTTGDEGVFQLQYDPQRQQLLIADGNMGRATGQVILSRIALVASERADRIAAARGEDASRLETEIRRRPEAYGRDEVADMLVELQDRERWAREELESLYSQNETEAGDIRHMEEIVHEWDEQLLERQMDEALAQYNAGSVDLGNDPVASGRRSGLKRLAILDAEWAALPKLPAETGGSAWTLLYVILGAIAFTYLYRYLTRR